MEFALNNRVVVLVVVMAVLLTMFRAAWKLPGITVRQRVLKRISALLGMTFFVGFLWICWEFQPWMSAGRAVPVSSAHLGDCDFQIWQRKNNIATEPFTTWLFARKQGANGSRSCWISKISIARQYFRKENARIVVLESAATLGIFDGTNRPSHGSRTTRFFQAWR